MTLIEAMVVLALIGVLTAMAAPGLSSIFNRLQAKAVSDALFSSLALARSEAVKRNVRGVLCRSRDGASCAASGGFEQGWIVFADKNNNAVVDSDEVVIHRHAALAGTAFVVPHFTVPGYVSFTPLGQAQTVNGAMLIGHFSVCLASTSEVEVRQVVVNATGRARTAKTTEAHCP